MEKNKSLDNERYDEFLGISEFNKKEEKFYTISERNENKRYRMTDITPSGKIINEIVGEDLIEFLRNVGEYCRKSWVSEKELYPQA